MIGHSEKGKIWTQYVAITNYFFFSTGDIRCVILSLAAQQVEISSWMSFDHPFIDNAWYCACHFQSWVSPKPLLWCGNCCLAVLNICLGSKVYVFLLGKETVRTMRTDHESITF